MPKMFEPIWKSANNKWKCPLHNMCSYLAMFPPALPNYFIEQFTQPGDWVMDPFSGRGTALLEAAKCGRVPIGNDLNPLAYILSYSKVHLPFYQDIQSRIDFLKNNYVAPDVSQEPEDIKMLYDLDVTLPQLLYLKEKLDKKDRVDIFLLGALMGIMHGPIRKDGTSANLSISMPNTFSMSPNYVRSYIQDNRLNKPIQDVFDCLKDKVKKIYPFNDQLTEGEMFNENALHFTGEKYEKFNGKIKLIITSPPYLKVINYGKYNWIRLWLLNESSQGVDNTLKFKSAYHDVSTLRLSDDLKLEQYLEFMRTVIRAWENMLTNDGLAVIVIGDVDDHKGKYVKLAEKVWDFIKDETTLNLVAIVKDKIDGNSKVTKIWGQQRKGNATKVDRLLILSKSDQRLQPNIKRNIRKIFFERYGGVK